MKPKRKVTLAWAVVMQDNGHVASTSRASGMLYGPRAAKHVETARATAKSCACE